MHPSHHASFLCILPMHPSCASFVCILLVHHSYASLCILMHPYASLCILMHPHASSCIIMHPYALLCMQRVRRRPRFEGLRLCDLRGGESWPTAAISMENPYCNCKLTTPVENPYCSCSLTIPMENPYCSCKLTRVRPGHVRGRRGRALEVAIRREFCHSAAPPSPVSRRFNTDREGVSAK